jgi:hypothetical protein
MNWRPIIVAAVIAVALVVGGYLLDNAVFMAVGFVLAIIDAAWTLSASLERIDDLP